jgi:hypothetical protein
VWSKQYEGRQVVPTIQRRQAPEPLHWPSWPQEAAACCEQSSTGSVPADAGAQAPDPLHAWHGEQSSAGSVPARFAKHVPTCPAMLQALQVSVHAVLQQ